MQSMFLSTELTPICGEINTYIGALKGYHRENCLESKLDVHVFSSGVLKGENKSREENFPRCYSIFCFHSIDLQQFLTRSHLYTLQPFWSKCAQILCMLVKHYTNWYSIFLHGCFYKCTSYELQNKVRTSELCLTPSLESN